MADRYWVGTNTIGVFGVGAQELQPEGLFFKPDGTKMYVVGSIGDDVNEYDLSTAWDISTASYVQNVSVSQDSSPQDVFFKSDGTKMYVVGTQLDRVYEYGLSTAWDVSTATVSTYKVISTQEATPTGLYFRSDGIKMYIVGSSGDEVNEYDLSTAWDISTASYLQNFSILGQGSLPSGIFFKSDGTKMYVSEDVNNRVNEYGLSTAWDISTASYSTYYSVTPEDTNPRGVFFKSDGTVMYFVGYLTDSVYSYPVSSAWDISSIAPDVWNGTAGNKWSTTSGGSGGASVPTTSDAVFFDANSGSSATLVPVASGNTGAGSLNFTGFTGAFGGTASITVAGSVTANSTMSYMHTGTITITGTGTITSAGQTFSPLIVNSAGITVTLGDALTLFGSGTLSISAGTFNSANYNISCNAFVSNTTNARTISLGSSTITVATNANAVLVNATNLTFNAGTSQFNLTDANAQFYGGNVAYYNVAFTSASGGTRQISGGTSQNFNQLTSVGANSHNILFLTDLGTINTWNIKGSAGKIAYVLGSPTGTRRNFSLTNSTAGLVDYLGVQDIGVNQADKFYVGDNSVDGGNNLNVIFSSQPSSASSNFLMLLL